MGRWSVEQRSRLMQLLGAGTAPDPVIAYLGTTTRQDVLSGSER